MTNGRRPPMDGWRAGRRWTAGRSSAGRQWTAGQLPPTDGRSVANEGRPPDCNILLNSCLFTSYILPLHNITNSFYISPIFNFQNVHEKKSLQKDLDGYRKSEIYILKSILKILFITKKRDIVKLKNNKIYFYTEVLCIQPVVWLRAQWLMRY